MQMSNQSSLRTLELLNVGVEIERFIPPVIPEGHLWPERLHGLSKAIKQL